MVRVTKGSKKGKRSFWANLQPRERNLLMGLVVVAVMMSLTVLFVLRGSRFSEMEAQILDQKQALDLVYTGGASYREKLEQKAEREASISDKALSFSTLIERASAAAEVSVSDQGEKPVFAPGEGVRRRTYGFHLRDVTLAQLTKFLLEVESESGHILSTQRLHIRSPSANEDRLNRVDIELATWERVAEDQAADEAQ